jgi:GPH family glycoside/pentoside/hexuronide:cation symporter
MNLRSRIAYGALGAPLAMAALPVYVYTPKLYGDEFGLGLALTGLILLLSRLVDTVQDPWLGKLSDYLHSRRNGWQWLISIAACCLALSFVALFNPPELSSGALMLWLAVSLVLVYTAHSAINITYLAWGASASDDPHERTRIVASREVFGIFGVTLASLLPMLLALWFDESGRWMVFGITFSAVLLVAAWILLQQVAVPQRPAGSRAGIMRPLRHRPFRRLATLFFLNGLAVAIAATLSLFYIADVLQLEPYSGAFLALYFLSGAVSLPFWLKLSRKLGKPLAWAIGAVIAVIAFVWAVQLGAGDLWPYALICAMSGTALGADLALPTAIAADIIPTDEKHHTASYFGIWSLIGKSVLALAAGLTLPLLAGFGYQPGGSQGLLALAICYAGIPCLIKIFSAALIWRWHPSLEVNHVT